MGTANSPLCKLCNTSTIGNLQHTFFQCQFNDGAGQLLINCLQNHIPGITAEAILHLDFPNLDDDMSLPVTLITAITLNYIWNQIMSSSKFSIRCSNYI